MSKIGNMMAKQFPWVDVWTPDGTKQYQFTLLTGKKGHQVFHQTVSTILRAISGILGSGNNPLAKIEGFRQLDFDTVWGLAEDLLSGCVVRPDVSKPDVMFPIRDVNDTDYFHGKEEELYCAIWFALKANYPNSWSRLQKAGLDIGQKVEAAMKSQLSTALDQAKSPVSQ